MKRALSLTLYNLLLSIFVLVDMTKWLIASVKQTTRSITNKPSTGNEKRDWTWGQKYGLVNKKLLLKNESNNKTILIHCASVGEVVAAVPLIKKLIIANSPQNKDLKFVITTNTKTGKEQLLGLLTDDVKPHITHTYLPIDLPWLMSSLLKQVQPCLTIIMEVELWPNLINQCEKRKVPVCIVNARLTDKTVKGYKKLSSISLPMIKQLNRVYARNQSDYDNYLSLGLDNEKLVKLGNIKFDIEHGNTIQANELRQLLNLTNRKVIIAGSTHEGEESLVVEAYKQFKTQFPELLLIICPRHPQRFESVFNYLSSQALNVSKMSELTAAENITDVLLGDQMGKLGQLYGVCDIAFVGGSFVKRGGHNPIEAAAFAKPVLMGPHIYNNPEICHTLADDGGLVICNSHYEFISQLNVWLTSPEKQLLSGQQALQTLSNNSGITQTICSDMLKIVNG